MTNPEVHIINGYDNSPPIIRIFDQDTTEEFRIDREELEAKISTTIKAGRFIITKTARQKYKRLKLI